MNTILFWIQAAHRPNAGSIQGKMEKKSPAKKENYSDKGKSISQTVYIITKYKFIQMGAHITCVDEKF